MQSAGIFLGFLGMASLTVCAALLVLLSRNLLHAVIFMVLSFMGMAGLFLTLSADFIAMAQVLIYGGAIPILLVFAVMLTPFASRDNGNSLFTIPAVLIGVGFAGMVGLVAILVEWPVRTGAELAAQSFATTAAGIGGALVGRHALAFELASVLLLSALIGAIVLVREDEG